MPTKRAPRNTLDISQQAMQKISQEINKNPLELFHIPMARRLVTIERLKTYSSEGVSRAETQDSAVIDQAAEYNAKQLGRLVALDRPQFLIDVLPCIWPLYNRRASATVLCVGPRSENEIFMLISKGFRAENITGLDLISYSEFVDVGDMHAMPYADNSFDVVFLGWVLGYSNDCQKAANEVIRVTKPGGYVAVGVERPVPETLAVKDGDHGIDGTYFYSVDELIALFGEHVRETVFRVDDHPTLAHETVHLMAIMELE
ncbi:MAG: hypothetical protein CMM77_11805 [Rhodospirillaceae bacterium]|nr:hypothetical protein [Magnetovibrio sp.]MAY67802.1 hypothetical protein [Rhodospirillaceae bacterium]